MAATIKDVAKLAGVSVMTVSRVLNNHPSVKPATRQTVLAAMHTLKYSPHNFARTMVSGKTYAIGLLVAYDLNKFPAEFLTSVLLGMSNRLNMHGYNLNLYFDRRSPLSRQPFSRIHLDGLFVLNVEMDASIAEWMKELDLPIVLVNQRADDPDVYCVASDDESGACEAVRHLLERGHRRIAFIGGNPNYSTSVERKRGYRRALGEYGIAADPALERIGHFEKQGGYEAMKGLLAENREITAVFAANDLMALGASRAIKEAGLNIPAQIALAGFDDADFAEDMEPPLTTVKKERARMGTEAADLMLAILAGKQEAKEKQVILRTQVILRASSGSKRG